MFDKFQMKLQKIIGMLSSKNSPKNEFDDLVVTESSLGYNSVKVIYYRTVDSYCVYRSIMINEKDEISLSVLDKEDYPSLEEIKKEYSERFDNVELYNLLSVDYVYLYKSGVFVDGTDLRTRDQILSDKIVHCLYVNEFLDEVLVHHKHLSTRLYKPFDGNYNDKNVANWSLEMVDNFLSSDRIKVFISSDTLFTFNKISKSIIVNPIELLTELECTAIGCGFILSHCGDLGMQIC